MEVLCKMKDKQKYNEYMKNYYRKNRGNLFGKSKYGIKYTIEEEKFIKDNYNNLSNKKIGEKINRTPLTIKKKMQSMGLSRIPEQSINIIKEANKNRIYLKYAANNPSWRKMITLPDKKRILESHFVWSKHNNQEVPKGHVVHHKDLNPLNNNPKNLELMKKGSHNKFHTSNDGVYGKLKREGKLKWELLVT
jgi:hypothetical protein